MTGRSCRRFYRRGQCATIQKTCLVGFPGLDQVFYVVRYFPMCTGAFRLAGLIFSSTGAGGRCVGCARWGFTGDAMTVSYISYGALDSSSGASPSDSVSWGSTMGPHGQSGGKATWWADGCRNISSAFQKAYIARRAILCFHAPPVCDELRSLIVLYYVCHMSESFTFMLFCI